MMQTGAQDTPPSQFELFRAALQRRVRHWLDSSVPHVAARWATFVGLLGLFFLRVYFLQGFFIVAYALMIFVMNQFIGFISPPIDPETDGPILPSSQREASEYRPFQRQVPEFKFWFNSVRAVGFAFLATLSSALDLPVFWPILVFYFLVLLTVSMQKRLVHMWKHKYMPCDCGKRAYKRPGAGKKASGPTFMGSSFSK